ncbi:hypothetical protein FC46_GL000756 [Lactobacillus kalixensis DSM 16043]|uniref:Mub B2-like domain-containing protein n=1 Tax=Lactobacillus kalixensis DSM 16043 TaxID=1423763 RepID=A0A0R1U8D3_9LACO|nr:hypothetical protein FC46_GL000756 [Lactobacillus kalixensis DSM 16043]
MGLASVLVGISLLGYAQPVQVKADDAETSSSDVQVVFGHIIPVTDNGEEIPNVPHPEYSRDPNDPEKAVATPAPKIKNYRVQKGQNYDENSNLVIPPSDPSQDTRLTYERYSAKISNKKSQTKEREQKKTSIFEFMKRNKNQPETSPQEKETQTNTTPSTNDLNSDLSQNGVTSAANNASSGLNEDATDLNSSVNESSISSSVESDNLESSSQTDQPATKVESNDKASTTDKDKVSKNSEKLKERKKKDGDQSISNDPKSKSGTKKRTDQRPVVSQAIMPEKVKLPPNTLTVTLRIVDHDQDDAVLTEQTIQGQKGDRIVFDNLKQSIEIYNYSGYRFSKVINVTSNVDMKISDIDHIELGVLEDEDLIFNVEMVHKLVRVTSENCDNFNISSDKLSYTTTLTVKYKGAGKKDPENKIEKATWSRTLTADAVTGEVVKGKYDTDFKPDIDIYPEVKTPEVDGFKADKKEIDGIKVNSQNIEKTVIFTPLKSEELESDLEKEEKAAQDSETKQTESKKLTQKDIDDAQSLINEAQGILASLGIGGLDHDLNEKIATDASSSQSPTLELGDLLKPVDSKVQYAKQEEKIPEKVEEQVTELAKEKEAVQEVEVEQATEKTPKKELEVEVPKPVPDEKETSPIENPQDSEDDAPTPEEVDKTDESIQSSKEVLKPKIEATSTQKDKNPEPEVKISKTNNKKQEIEVQSNGETKTFIQTIHFVDENGKKLHKDHIEVIAFVKQGDGWDKSIDTFATVTAPVIDTYYCKDKSIHGKTVMPDDSDLRPEITVTYHKMANVIPVDLDGNLIEITKDKPESRQFANDPHDASKALADQAVPNIKGYKATVKTITPVNPAINIPVVYNVEI